MPALTRLDERLQGNPEWQTQYAQNLPDLHTGFANLPIIHVLGQGKFEALLDPAPDEVQPYHLQVSNPDTGQTSRKTIAAEDALELGRCLYFYLGRARLNGGVAFAFGLECILKRPVSATPFDTGGLYDRKVHLELSNYEDTTLKTFTHASIAEFASWLEAGATYIAAYFQGFQAYWHEPPCFEDPERIFSNQLNTWQAWTLEVRFHEGQDIFEAEKWCTTPSAMEYYRRKIREAPSEKSRLMQFYHKSLHYNGTLDYEPEIEQWARERVGIK